MADASKDCSTSSTPSAATGACAANQQIGGAAGQAQAPQSTLVGALLDPSHAPRKASQGQRPGESKEH